MAPAMAGWLTHIHGRLEMSTATARRMLWALEARECWWLCPMARHSANPEAGAAEFGQAQGWNNEQHVRTVGDVNSDGKDDIIAIGTQGVMVALSNGTGFDSPHKWSGDFGPQQGWSRQEHVLMVAPRKWTFDRPYWSGTRSGDLTKAAFNVPAPTKR